MNFVILSSVLSCGEFLLVCVVAHAVCDVAQRPGPPGWFGKVNRQPGAGGRRGYVWATGLVGALAFLSNCRRAARKILPGAVQLLEPDGFPDLARLSRCVICDFARAWVAQGAAHGRAEVPLGASIHTVPWIAVALFLIVPVWRQYRDLSCSRFFSWFDFISSYGVVPFFLDALSRPQTREKKTRVVPLRECNLDPD